LGADFLGERFGLAGLVAAVTGGSGMLGGAMARGLAAAGAGVAIVGRRRQPAEAVVAAIAGSGGQALAVQADVTDAAQLARAADEVCARWGRVDILVNAAGGNLPEAVVPVGGSVLDLSRESFQEVLDLNLTGTYLASQAFVRAMVDSAQRAGREPAGSIVNVSSMGAARALTRVAGYSAAKSAVENLTRWLAVDLSRKFGAGLRVNAIAPGFFVAEQNRDLLIAPEGGLTARGRAILEHTPAGRFGEPDDVVGAVVWLASPAAAFVNGVVIQVDGGFSAFSGV